MDGPEELPRIGRERDYYRKQVDELTALNLQLDFRLSNALREITQKKQAFSLLSELSRKLGASPEILSILDAAGVSIGQSMAMDRTVVMLPEPGGPGRFRPARWLGYPSDREWALDQLRVDLPADVARGERILLSNAATPPERAVAALREDFHVPYFICASLVVDGAAIGAVLAGRLEEKRPVSLPLDAGDVDSFRAMAAMISATVRGMKVASLEELNRLKTEFFANISHEFRTPITLTLGPLEGLLAARYGPLSEEARALIHGMRRNQQRLLGLINEILDLAKLESGKMTLSVSSVPDFNAYVRDRAEQFLPWAEKAGLRLEQALSPEVSGASVYLDLDKFDRVLLNLLSNAFKFTPRGFVRVETARQGDECLVRIQDSGPGMAAGELSRIFDRFEQAGQGTRSPYAGTGIGLSLVKEIVELHGGRIEARSQPGRGSTFELAIKIGKDHLDPAFISCTPCVPRVPGGEGRADQSEPVAPAPDPLADIAEAAEKNEDEGEELCRIMDSNRVVLASSDPSRSTVLLVEDNPELRSYVRGLLGKDYQVLLGVDGLHGLEIASARAPDLILSDLKMPRMTGLELCERVKRDPLLSGVPFVLLTSSDEAPVRLASLDRGADDFLGKPFSEAELLARVRNLVSLRRQHLRLKRELRAAREIQLSLVPPAHARFGAAELESVFVPTEELSGDFYDYFRVGEWIYLYVADVTSHGTASAQVTFLLKGAFGEALRRHPAPPSLGELMSSVAASYSSYGLQYGVAIQAARYHLARRELHTLYANAPSPMRVAGKTVISLSFRPSPALEGSDAIPGPDDYPVLVTSLDPGDSVYFVSDGCHEFIPAGSEHSLGRRRLRDILVARNGSEAWAREVLQALQAERGRPDFEDDLTILRLWIRGEE